MTQKSNLRPHLKKKQVKPMPYYWESGLYFRTHVTAYIYGLHFSMRVFNIPTIANYHCFKFLFLN